MTQLMKFQVFPPLTYADVHVYAIVNTINISFTPHLLEMCERPSSFAAMKLAKANEG